MVVVESVVTANDAVLLVVVLQSISEQFHFEPAPTAAVAELGVATSTLHVVTARDSLNVNLSTGHVYTHLNSKSSQRRLDGQWRKEDCLRTETRRTTCGTVSM